MNPFDDDDNKVYISMTYTAYGKTHSVSMDFDDDCTWSEVLDPIIATLEAAYGYSFDLDTEALGIYYPGKNDD